MVGPVPLITGAAAIFPYSDELAKKHTHAPVFQDSAPIVLFKKIGSSPNARIALPRGCYPVGQIDKRTKGLPISTTSSFKPRSPEQSRVVDEIVALLKKGVNHIARAPTGFGKTIVGAQVIHLMGMRTLVIVNKEDIVDQWVDAFKKVLNLPDHKIGRVQGNVVRYKNCPVTIALIQSVSKPGRYPSEFYESFGFVLVDEVHRLGAEHFSEAAWLFPAWARLGLSATPKRKDGRDIVFRQHIGPVLVKTEQMTLSCRVLRKNTRWKVPRWKDKLTHEWVKAPHSASRHAHILKSMVKDPIRNGHIVKFVMKAAEKGRHIIIFSHQLQHLDVLMALCIKAGLPSKDCALYVGGLNKAQREAAKLKQFVFATYGMCSEATDMPRKDTGVLGTPRSDVVQTVGRLLREHEDKAPPVLMDPVDLDSHVYAGFAINRLSFYKARGFEVVNY